MISSIIIKEIRETIASPKFIIIYSACSILLILGFIVGVENYKKSVYQYKNAISENIQQYKQVKNWRDVNTLNVFIEPNPISVFVTGISNDIGRSITITKHSVSEAYSSKHEDEPYLATMKDYDLNFIFGYVISLFAIILGYNSIAGEKKKGMLRLIFSNSIPRVKFIIGKIIGLNISLLLPLTGAILIGVLYLLVSNIYMSVDSWLKLFLIISAGYLFISCMMSISIFVSSLTHTPSTALISLLVVWIAVVHIIPSVCVNVIGRSNKVTSSEEISINITALSVELEEIFKRKLENYSSSPNQEMNQVIDQFQKYMDSLVTDKISEINKLQKELNEKKLIDETRRTNYALNVAKLSPTTLFTIITSKIAGTDVNVKEQFSYQAKLFQIKFSDFIKSKTKGKSSFSSIDETENIILEEIPTFKFIPLNFEESIRSTWYDFILLITYSIIFIFLSIVFFHKYDVR